MVEVRSTIMPTMRYRDAPAAIDWLCKVFGFERHAVYAKPDGTIAHAELTLGGGMIMLGSCKDDAYGRGFTSPDKLDGKETRSAYIVVPNAIARPIEDMPYGSREFTVRDPEGHSWSVGTYDPWAAHG